MESSLCKCISSTQAKLLSYWLLPYSAPCRAVILIDFLVQQTNQNNESRKVDVFLWSCPYLGKKTNLTWTSHFSKDRLNLQVLGQPSRKIYMAKDFSPVKGPSWLVWGSRQGNPWTRVAWTSGCRSRGWQSPASLAGWTEETSFMVPGNTYATVVYWENDQRKNHFLPPKWMMQSIVKKKRKIPLKKPSNFLLRDTTLLHREVWFQRHSYWDKNQIF